MQFSTIDEQTHTPRKQTSNAQASKRTTKQTSNAQASKQATRKQTFQQTYIQTLRAETKKTLTDEIRNALKGLKLTEAQARELETALLADEDDFEARSKLLGYYHSHRCIDRGYLSKFTQNVLWMIKCMPDSRIAGSHYARFDIAIDGPVPYEEGKKLWLEQVKGNPTNTEILKNAALYMVPQDRHLVAGETPPG